ncbi:MAG: ferredoxin [Mycobacteriales bacterium]
MRVAVDSSKCQGHTQCAMSAPTVFGLDDEDGHAVVLMPDVPADLEADVRKAALNCPERAVVIS